MHSHALSGPIITMRIIKKLKVELIVDKELNKPDTENLQLCLAILIVLKVAKVKMTPK